MAQVLTGSLHETLSKKPYPQVIPDTAHVIARSDISDNAVKILHTLLDAGFESYLVGGCVRDLLLGRTPKDFDIATAAEPEQVRRLFRRCRLIGRRFRLAHVRMGRDVIEVATFRAGHGGQDAEGRVNASGLIVRDNVYGTLEEDAWRRDFTLNALYYDVRDASVVDFTGGIADLEARAIRMIGDPAQRYQEDPVRMLRAIRFAAKLGLSVHPETEAPIRGLARALRSIPAARLFDEVLKLVLAGHAEASYALLRHYGVFAELFAQTDAALSDPLAERFVRRALVNTDLRIAECKPVTPGFLFAALLWEPMCQRVESHLERGLSQLEAIDVAGGEVIAAQCEQVAFPRRFSTMAREIWMMQPKLEHARGRRAMQLLERVRFRAAYDFLALRCEAGEDEVCASVQWWTERQGPRSDAPAPPPGRASVYRRGRGGRRRPRPA